MDNKKLRIANFILFVDVLPLSHTLVTTIAFVLMSKHKFSVAQVCVVFMILHAVFFMVCMMFYNNCIANTDYIDVQDYKIEPSKMLRYRSHFLYERDNLHKEVCHSSNDFLISFAIVAIALTTLCILRECCIIETDVANTLMLGIGISTSFLCSSIMLFCMISYVLHYCAINNLKKGDIDEDARDKNLSAIRSSINGFFSHKKKKVEPDLHIDKAVLTEPIVCKNNHVSFTS